MDTIHFGAVFAFTAVDIFSREADVLLFGKLAIDIFLPKMPLEMREQRERHIPGF